jgi:hypothetical protein
MIEIEKLLGTDWDLHFTDIYPSGTRWSLVVKENAGEVEEKPKRINIRKLKEEWLRRYPNTVLARALFAVRDELTPAVFLEMAKIWLRMVEDVE